jgi:hypothetical protein
MDSFQSTHRKFIRSQYVSEHVSTPPSSKGWDQFMNHQIDLKQAWNDGEAAAHRLLSGDLPRELHSVLGIAQLASAIRPAMDDVHASAALEETFLSDLNRWRQLLPSDSHAAFDYYADILWDNQPPRILLRRYLMTTKRWCTSRICS